MVAKCHVSDAALSIYSCYLSFGKYKYVHHICKLWLAFSFVNPSLCDPEIVQIHNISCLDVYLYYLSRIIIV